MTAAREATVSNLTSGGGPTATDYVVVTDAYLEQDDKSTRPVVAFSPPRHVFGDIWIAQVDPAVCQAILRACTPAGENFKPTLLSACSYAFYRLNAPAGQGHEYDFDSDNALYACIALSRIVHSTSVGFEHAARVRQLPNGLREIIPVTQPFLNPFACVIDPNENWLIPDDLPDLRTLLEAFHSGPVPARLGSALWHHEVVARHHFIDLRWPLLTASLEALVRIRNEKLPSGRFVGSTKVFVDRLLAIGALDVALALTEGELEDIYEQRSLLAHGLPFGALDEPRKALYRSQERLVRGIIRKAFLDTTFRDIFASDTNVATHLPLR